MPEDNGPDATHVDEPDPTDVVVSDADHPDTAEDDTEPETYPAEKVRQLRDENAKWRARAREAEQRADTLSDRSKELFALKVAALDKLEDVADLAYDPDLLNDPDALAAAVDELIAKRPHYAKRPRPTGSVGQGSRGDTAAAPTFGALLQA